MAQGTGITPLMYAEFAQWTAIQQIPLYRLLKMPSGQGFSRLPPIVFRISLMIKSEKTWAKPTIRLKIQ